MERQRGGDDFKNLSERLKEVRFDQAIEFLTHAASGYSNANLNPSAEQFLLMADLIHRGLINGEFNFDSSGKVESLRCAEMTAEGWKFLDACEGEQASKAFRNKPWHFLPGTLEMVTGRKS